MARDSAFRRWKEDKTSDKAQVLRGYQGIKRVKSRREHFRGGLLRRGSEEWRKKAELPPVLHTKGSAKLCNKTGRREELSSSS